MRRNCAAFQVNCSSQMDMPYTIVHPRSEHENAITSPPTHHPPQPPQHHLPIKKKRKEKKKQKIIIITIKMHLKRKEKKETHKLREKH